MALRHQQAEHQQEARRAEHQPKACPLAAQRQARWSCPALARAPHRAEAPGRAAHHRAHRREAHRREAHRREARQAWRSWRWAREGRAWQGAVWDAPLSAWAWEGLGLRRAALELAQEVGSCCEAWAPRRDAAMERLRALCLRGLCLRGLCLRVLCPEKPCWLGSERESARP